MALVFRLEAAELGYFDEEVNFEELDDAIFELVSAAIYELRLRPYGEKLDLDELKKQAVRDFEGSTAQPDQAESGTK
ncbi:hypothetical protein ASH02_19540 [Nocardioides sp. Soil796]|nr:hypothetical protein ASH02_19540 [Nocardioides sp. Soil796]